MTDSFIAEARAFTPSVRKDLNEPEVFAKDQGEDPYVRSINQ